MFVADRIGRGKNIRTREWRVRHSAAAKMFRAVFTAEMRDFFLPTITS
jgi:hypothetical protein